MDEFDLRMLRAALKQALRDRSDKLSQEEVNQILDQILKLDKQIEDHENLRKKK